MKKFRYVVYLSPILYSLSALILLQPYFLWNHKYYILYSTIISLFAFLLSRIKSGFQSTDKNLFLAFVSFLLVIYLNISTLRTIFVSLFFYFPILLFLLETNRIKLLTFHIFLKVLSFFLVPGLIIYFVNMFGIELPWINLEPLNPLKTVQGFFYKNYFGAIVLSHTSNIDSFPYRFLGIFDEPGVIGTLVGIIIFSNDFNPIKKISNFILFVSGLLSLSFFFYGSLLIFFLYKIFQKRNFYNFSIIIIFSLILLVFFTDILENDFIYRNILSRFDISNGWLAGDNRTNDYFDNFYRENILNNFYNFIFGLGRNYSLTNSSLMAAASWKKVVLERGFLGLSFLISFFFIIPFYMQKKVTFSEYLIYITILLLTIYQRPGIFELPYIIIFIGFFKIDKIKDVFNKYHAIT